jgi:surface antigen
MNRPKHFKKASVGILCFVIFLWFIFLKKDHSLKIGDVVDRYKGVAIYHNGFSVFKNNGKHYSKTDYYFGQKWQCVEFVKRFFYETKSHKMPNVWGHAKDFFDSSIEQGQVNSQRGMLQFKNGGNEKPKIDDLIVFNNSEHGHVAVVSLVTEESIEIVQQNIFGVPRQKFRLEKRGANYFVSSPNTPAGWLRILR